MTIHTNRWWPDTCGCCIEYEWDDQDDPNTRVHTGKRVHKACAAHPAKPAHEHFATLQDENKRKNKLLQLAMEAFPTILGEQVTSYGKGRYAWKTSLLQIFSEPIPCKGRQGLWDWECKEGESYVLDKQAGTH